MEPKDMTLEDFKKVPTAKWDEPLVGDAFVILPADEGEELHDSGYRRMSVVVFNRGELLGRTSMCSDALHLGGIADPYIYPGKTPHITWNVDCLPKSGLLRVFSYSHKLEVGPALSSLEIKPGEEQ